MCISLIPVITIIVNWLYAASLSICVNFKQSTWVARKQVIDQTQWSLQRFFPSFGKDHKAMLHLHWWSEGLKIIKFTKFKDDTSKASKDIAPQSREIFSKSLSNFATLLILKRSFQPCWWIFSNGSRSKVEVDPEILLPWWHDVTLLYAAARLRCEIFLCDIFWSGCILVLVCDLVRLRWRGFLRHHIILGLPTSRATTTEREVRTMWAMRENQEQSARIVFL